jgi:hypothetical protein
MKKVCWLAMALAVALTTYAGANESSVAADYQRISKEFEKAQKDYGEAYQKASEKQRESLKYPDARKYATQMIEIAEKEPKSAGALDALIWAVQRAYHLKDTAPRALKLLEENHIESEKLDDICQRLVYGGLPESKPFLEKVVEKNPHDDVKAAASLALGQMLAQKDAAEAEKHLNNVVDKYGTKTQKERAKGELFEMHNLAVGKVAPEIEGEDVDGKRFKLSDYRGKVVVIDFWGDW